jgi:hypothetical protein
MNPERPLGFSGKNVKKAVLKEKNDKTEVFFTA